MNQPDPIIQNSYASLLWLYRRLPNGYGRMKDIEKAIIDLGKNLGYDVPEDSDVFMERE